MWIISWSWKIGPALYSFMVIVGAWELAHPVYMCFVDFDL